jgi:hypothetical protein
MKVNNWKNCAEDRNKWKSIVERAKTYGVVAPVKKKKKKKIVLLCYCGSFGTLNLH